jgi:hypothetical protein
MVAGMKRKRGFIGFDIANIKPKDVFALDSLDSIMGVIREKNDPDLIEKFTRVTRFLVETRGAYHAPTSVFGSPIAASTFSSVADARQAMGVDYTEFNSDHQWSLKLDDDMSDNTSLSPWAG